MKILKITLLAFTLIFMSCKSDDDTSADIIPILLNLIPDITIDVDDVIARPANSDITDLINFGQPAGTPTSEYLAELDVDDNFILGVPEGLGTGDKFLYFDFQFFDETNEQIDNDTVMMYLNPGEIPEGTEYFDYEILPGVEVPLPTKYQFQAIMALDNDDINYKYDILCLILRDNVFYGPYIIDPKIRIKSVN